jgi:mono/diheme cytochrome c family protein
MSGIKIILGRTTVIKKALLAVIALLVLGTAFFFFRFTVLLPRDIPVPAITLPTSPAEIERGRYLANHVAVCMDCHSTRDWNYFAGPLVPGTLGKGGEVFDHDSGLPGVLISKNITPHALGDWSDGEVFRAVTGGLQNDGDALFPLMPYDAYRTMDEGDVLAIIAYLRTLAPIDNDVPDHQLDFPLNLIVNSIPKAAELRTINRDDPVEYGGYLAQMAGCTWCHTPINATQQSVPEQLLAGGHEFMLNGKLIRASNISSDKDTGIGNWTRAQFIARFRQYQGEAGRTIPLDEDGNNTLMSWTLFADMTDEDLGAIYTFLMQSEPRSNAVVSDTKF